MAMATIAMGFPPGLNTANAPTDLKPSETPDSYGFDLSRDDRIYKGTIPSGSSRIVRTYTVDTVDYFCHYHRLWAASNSILDYGAPFYTEAFYRQGLGRLTFNEDTSPILAFVPFDADSMYVGKATGGYIVTNCSDNRAYFRRSDIMQGLRCDAANKVIVVNNVLYVSNGYGLMGYEKGQVVEYTRPLRNDLTNFTSQVLTADYEKGRVIGGSNFVYEPGTSKFFRYSGTSFRYTSPQIHNRNYEPFSVGAITLQIEHIAGDLGSLSLQVRVEDKDWSEPVQVTLPYEEEQYTLVDVPLDYEYVARRWQMRITDISGQKAIKSISIDSDKFNMWDYTE